MGGPPKRRAKGKRPPQNRPIEDPAEMLHILIEIWTWAMGKIFKIMQDKNLATPRLFSMRWKKFRGELNGKLSKTPNFKAGDTSKVWERVKSSLSVTDWYFEELQVGIEQEVHGFRFYEHHKHAKVQATLVVYFGTDSDNTNRIMFEDLVMSSTPEMDQ